jgi:D-alanine-D-alanine ligase
VRIALLYNAKPAEAVSPPAQEVPDDTFAEYDDAVTVTAIADALAPFGTVVALEADGDLPCRLKTGAFDIAFNIAEGYGRRGREAQAAAVCELLRVPSTHSDAVTLGITLDKMLARRIVAPEVRVAPALLLEVGDTLPSRLELVLPVVVKPNDEGSSKGIRDDSVGSTVNEVRRLVTRLRERYGCPVLVEEYLPGTEVTVGIIGNGQDARVLGMMAIASRMSSPFFLYSAEAKRAFRERIRYDNPPRLPAATLDEIEALALRAYRLLGCRDVARLDFRLDAGNRPHFLECNPLPGLNPESSDLVILSEPAMRHGDLVRMIFAEALRRTGVVTV